MKEANCSFFHQITCAFRKEGFARLKGMESSMTKIFLLGTFHFHESPIDFYTEEMQQQLWDINERLVKFKPDAVAVEIAAHAQEAVNSCYKKFLLNDLSDCEKMRNNNEAIQVGYRLGKSIGLDKIHAIDDDTALGVFPEGETPEHIKNTFDKHMEKLHGFMNEKNILDMLRNINSDEWSYHNQQLYLVKNTVGAGGSYAGADWFGRWYMRNLKIFANLQKLCENYNRVFLLYGAGHLYILRELIKQCEDMELVDYREYLHLEAF